MYKLIIFAVTMLLLSSICNGQGKSTFGATRAQDTSLTVAQVKFTAYGGSLDTMLMIILPNGDVKKVAKNQFGATVNAGFGLIKTGSTIYVDSSAVATQYDLTQIQTDSTLFVTNSYLNDTLQYYEHVYNVNAFGATPYWIDSTDDDTRGVQQAINAVFGYTEVDFNATTGTATVVRVAPSANGVVFGNGEYDIRRRLVKFVNFVNGNDTVQRPANSQLYIPYEPFNAASQDLIGIKIKGPVMPSWNESAWGDAATAKFKKGFILHSHISNDGSSYPSILASVVGDTLSVGGSPTTLNGIAPHLENVWLRTYHDRNNGGNQLCGFDAFQSGWFTVEGSRIDGDTSGLQTAAPSFRLFGIRSQRTSTGTLGVIRNTIVTSGFKYGVVTQEHVILDNVNVFMCYYAFEQSGNARPTEFRNVLSQWNKHVLHTGDFITIANGEGNIMGELSAEMWEGAPKWYSAADTQIIDSLDYLRGNLEVEIFSTVAAIRDTFFKVKGATELTQISPYKTGGYVGGYTLSRGGFRTNRGDFQSGDGHITLLNNAYVSIRLGGADRPKVGLDTTSGGSRFIRDSRFSTNGTGIGLNTVTSHLYVWDHGGDRGVFDGWVWTSSNGGSTVSGVDSLHTSGTHYLLGTANLNKSAYTIAVVDSAVKNKLGWRSTSQLFNDGLVLTSAGGAAAFNYTNDQGFMGQTSITGSTFTSGAIAPNSILIYSHLTAGKIQLMSNGASGAVELYAGGITSSNLALSATPSKVGINNKLAISAGANKSMNTATLSSGTVTVNNTAVTANSTIRVQLKTPGGTAVGAQYKYSVIAGTSFTITSIKTDLSTETNDNSVVSWWIVDEQ